MWAGILYPVAWFILIVSGLALVTMIWFVWRDLLYNVLDAIVAAIHVALDASFDWFMDKIMGVRGRR